MKKILNLFILILVTFLFDFILTFFLISNFNFYEKIYPNLDHRIANNYYHHTFKANVNTFDYWGKYKYKFYTNSLGFKDGLNRKIEKTYDSKKRVIIIGDSFTEGIGIEYYDTFVGHLDKNNMNKNIEILNAGVASQSPIIYFKKIKHLIEVERVKFDQLIVFLDISDIPDEYYYDLNFNISNKKKFNLRDYLQDFFIKYSSIYLFLDFIVYKINIIKENLFLKYKTSKEFNLNFFKTNKDDLNLFKAINVERGMWSHDIEAWNLHGKKGRQLADFYLDKLVALSKMNKINITLVIYPWPIHIFYEHNSGFHRDFWKDWSQKRNIKLIDMFTYFESNNPEKIIKNFFIDGDIHWNKEGHYYVYEIMMKEYFNY